MIDPYAIVKRLTGCDLISPKDGKQLIEAVDGLIDEIKGKDALIQSLSSQLAEAIEGTGNFWTAIARAEAAEAERDRLAADVSEFMTRLGPRWFLEQGWFPASQQEENRATLDTAKGAKR